MPPGTRSGRTRRSPKPIETNLTVTFVDPDPGDVDVDVYPLIKTCGRNPGIKVSFEAAHGPYLVPPEPQGIIETVSSMAHAYANNITWTGK